MYTSIEANLTFQKLAADSTITTEKIIKSLIDIDMQSKERQRKLDGENYYDCQNDILKRELPENSLHGYNNRIPSGFYKKIVDQKVSYCIGKMPTIEGIQDDENFVNPMKFLKKLAKRASKKGIEWLYHMQDKEGKLSYKIIDSIECIPIWDTEYEDELQTMIRYYQIEKIDQDKSQKIKVNKVEVYDAEKISYYIQETDGEYLFDTSVSNNPVYYNSRNIIQMGEIVNTEYYGWGRVPFTPLFNNEKALSDLNNIKAKIDIYDLIYSDYANNLQQLQDAILVIINRGAEDYEAFLDKLKKYKIIDIDDIEDVGGASWLTLDLPIEARNKLLEITKENIFEDAQAVDTKKLGDGNITNVYIKSRFADLDLKAMDFEDYLTDFIMQYCEFYNIYAKLSGKSQIDTTKIDITYNHNMIINTTENIEIFEKSDGLISERTNLSNHAWVDDVDEEMMELEKDRAQRQERQMEFMDSQNNDNNENNEED